MTKTYLTVRVNLAERSYEIRIGTGSLAFAGEFLNPQHQVSRAIVVTDVRVERLHAQPVVRSLTATKQLSPAAA